MKDEQGAPFKDAERALRTYVRPDEFLIIRLDGKNFSSWTRSWEKPFDERIAEAMFIAMAMTTMAVQDALCGYTQSDECSIICAPMRDGAERWFGGQVEKIVSITASMFTWWFNNEIVKITDEPSNPGFFDSRAFNVRTVSEMSDYLAWRQNDARRNAVSMMAHKYLGERKVAGKSTAERREMLVAAGHNPDEIDQRYINGSLYFHYTMGSVEDATMRSAWMPQYDAGKIRNWSYFNYLDIDVERGIVSEVYADEIRRAYAETLQGES